MHINLYKFKTLQCMPHINVLFLFENVPKIFRNCEFEGVLIQFS